MAPIVEPGEDVVQLMAPTAVAAKLIGGTTIHRALKVPIQTTTDNKIGQFHLKGKTLKQLKEQWRPRKLVIIDEISMVNSELFLFISHRLGEAMGNKEPTGGLSVLCVGDLFQLSPVKGQEVWKPISGGFVFGKKIPPMHLWKLFSFSILSESQRAKEDPEFAKLLDRVGLGAADDEVLATLNSRRIFKDQDFEFESEEDMKEHQASAEFRSQKLPDTMTEFRLEDSLTEAQFLRKTAEWMHAWENEPEHKEAGHQMVAVFPRTVQCDTFAERMMALEGVDRVQIPAIDKPLGQEHNSRFDKKQSTLIAKVGDTDGLETVLSLGVGARVMIRLDHLISSYTDKVEQK